MKSEKWVLIWADIKSWMITSALMLAPILLGELITLVQGSDLGIFQGTVLLILGSLLKLAQKWYQTNTY